MENFFHAFNFYDEVGCCRTDYFMGAHYGCGFVFFQKTVKPQDD